MRWLRSVILLACVALLGWSFHFAVSRPLPELREGVVEIRRGWGLSEIGRAFFGSNRWSVGSFKAKVILTGRSRRLKAGEYELDRDSIRSLTRKLAAGRVLQYRVTVAEGVWASDIAVLLEGAGLCDRERLLSLIRDPAFATDMAGARVPSLEGYLFPETYFFTKGMSEEDILKTFVARFNEKARPLLRSDTHSAHDLLTLASMVEREAARDEERTVIAGVFWNRLRRRMPLESCVTVEYALGRKKKKLTDEDLRADSPYNTYRRAGLPPGPVGNPGLRAIAATVMPAATGYLFFVAAGDGSHHFSATWAEHLRAKRRAGRGR